MKYANGSVVFPRELLEEIQKYVHGDIVYIPRIDGRRKKWGEESGQRSSLINRNNHIRNGFKQGLSIDRLSEMHHLAHYTIKKIVYSKK